MLLKRPRLPKNGIIASLVILLITIVITFVTIDMTVNRATIIKSSSAALIGRRRSSDYGKVYEVMDTDNRRILSSGYGRRSKGNSSTVQVLSDTKLTLWSTDFHISPIADIKAILREVNRQVGGEVIQVIDKSLSGHCQLTNTCAGNDLKVLTKDNGIDLSPCPNKMRRDFYTYYSHNVDFMENVDVIVCTHAASLCELYMPFDKPMIIIASTRYEIGRHSEERWAQWNDNLQRVAAKKGNFVAANNVYDKYYIEHFTGIKNVLLLPSLATYVKSRAYADAKLSRRRTEVLLAPARDVNANIQKSMETALHVYNAACEREGEMVREMTGATLQIVPIRTLYPHFQYSDLAQHPAVVVIPYQVSFMTLFELYRMNIPLFVPSIDLLARWHQDHQVLKERVWASVRGDEKGREGSAVEKYEGGVSSSFSSFSSVLGHGTAFVASDGGDGVTRDHRNHDPNDEYSFEAVKAWIQHSDMYAWPHIHTFSSWAQLFAMLHGSPQSTTTTTITTTTTTTTTPHMGGNTTSSSSFSRVDLRRTSVQMAASMAQIEAEAMYTWKTIVSRLQHRKRARSAKKVKERQREGNKNNVHKQRQVGVKALGGGEEEPDSSMGTEMGQWAAVNRELHRRYGYSLDPSDCQAVEYFD